MSVRINVSYTDDREADSVLELLLPILDGFKVKKSKCSGGFKHVYIMPRSVERTPNASGQEAVEAVTKP